MKKWYNIATQSKDKAEIFIYGTIGKDWFGDGVAAIEFIKEFKALEQENVEIHINSPGGYVHEGMAIYNAIQSSNKNVDVYVDGMAASAAAFIAVSGNKLYIPENGMMMIHCAITGIYGNADAIRKEAELLDKLDGQIADIFSKKTGKTTDEIMSAMKEETYFTGREAVDYGLADEIFGEIKAVALSNLKGLPFKQKDKIENFFSNIINLSQGDEPVTEEELKAKHADLYNKIVDAAKNEGHAQGKKEGAEAERNRIQSIEALRNQSNASVIDAAKFDPSKTAENVAVDIIKAQNEQNKTNMNNIANDNKELLNKLNNLGNEAPASGGGEGEAAPSAGALNQSEKDTIAAAAAVVNKINNR